ncbi:MAG TPA: hypothetical protein VJZ32_06360 [Candidatus Bathyarchaeia archaeon]|nr:hypothetical protein [Candidatus Bathyarchaeia archaeon]
MPTDDDVTDRFDDLANDTNSDRNGAESQRWPARVNLPGGFTKQVYVNGQAITRTELNPTSQLLSISTSLSEQYEVNATTRGINIDSLEIWATGKIDSLTLSENEHSQNSDVEWRVYLKSNAPSEAIQELHEYTIRTSPFRSILDNRVTLNIEIISPGGRNGIAWCDPS